MPGRYAATGANVLAASPGKTALNVFQTSNTRRGRFYDIMFGSSGTPADAAVRWQARRSTAVGTEGAGVVPTALDSGDPASLFDGAEGHTVEPTYTAGSEFIDLALNQRASWRWIAAPGGEIVTPATAANGIGMSAFHASSTVATEATMHWEE